MKLSLITLFASAITGTVLFADNENYDGMAMAGGVFSSKSLSNSSWVKANLSSANFAYATLAGADFTEATLRDVSIFGVSAQNVNFTDADLSGAEFYWSDRFFYDSDYVSDLSGAKFIRSNLTGADLRYATLTGADFTDSVITGANFFASGLTLSQLYSTKNYKDKDLSVVGLSTVDLSGGSFSGVNLTFVVFTSATLTSVDFTNANLTDASLCYATLTNADFTEATLRDVSIFGVSAQNVNFTDADLSGANFYNSNYSYDSDYVSNLSGAKFVRANLMSANLCYATLTNADFTGTTLKDVSIYGVSAQNVNFTDADLSGANFYNSNYSYDSDYVSSDLRGAKFVRANLTSANLRYAMLTNADFTDSVITGADFSSASLWFSQLYSTKNYKDKDLSGVGLGSLDLSGESFSGVNLTEADFTGAILKSASIFGVSAQNVNFTDADLSGAEFYWSDYSFGDLDYVSDLSGAKFIRANLTNTDLRYATLTSADFTEATLKSASIWGVSAQNVNFTDADLSGTEFYWIDYSFYDTAYDSDLSGAKFIRANLTDASLIQATLTSANFMEANLTSADFTNANLTNANLTDASLRYATLTGADFTEATLTDVSIFGVSAQNVNFTDADLSGAEFNWIDSYSYDSDYVSNLSGAKFIRANLTDASLIQATLTNANFTEANLTDADLRYATLTSTDFSGATLTDVSLWRVSAKYVNFTDADLSGAYFYYYSNDASDLSGAKFVRANLTDASLIQATLTNANFTEANLTNADLRYATLTNADFSGADLRGASYEETDLNEAVIKNTILTDGDISGFSMSSAEDSFVVRKYTPKVEGGESISAKIQEDATISGGAVLSVAEEGTLDISPITLTFGIDNEDEAISSISVAESGSITLASGAKIVIDYAGTFDENTSFAVMNWTDSSNIVGLDSLTKGGNLSLLVDGVAYDTSLWDFSTNNNALTIFGVAASVDPEPDLPDPDDPIIPDPDEPVIPEEPERVVISSASQSVDLTDAESSADFDGTLTAFSGTVSGAGSLNSSGTLTFSGDASAHTGTTKITAGTFTIAESAELGTGAFDVAGTLAISGSRTFSNTTSGNGKIEISSGSTTFANDVGVKTLSISQGASATLNAGVGLTHANAEVQIAGMLALNGDRDFSATLSGAGKLTTSGDVNFASDASAFTGTTEITLGTFTVSESAVIGTGDFAVVGTLALNGNRTFANATSGAGKLDVVSGATTFTQNVGTESLDISSGASVTFAGTSDGFAGTLTGAGSLATTQDFALSGDASGFGGKTSVTVGTFAVSDTATLGNGSFDVAGTLALNGNRTFENATSGDGSIEISSGVTTFVTNVGTKTLFVAQGVSATLDAGVDLTHANAEAQVAGTLNLLGARTVSAKTSGNGVISLASGSDVSFAKAVGVKTLSVAQGATLRGSVLMTYGAAAELSLAGTLVLNVDKGEKVSLGGGKVTLASSAKLDVVGSNSPFTRATSAQINALESGQKVVLIENGTVSGDVVAFLNTDSDLAAYAQNYAVIYDESNSGLSVQVVKNAATLADGIDASELSANFVDWALADADEALNSLTTGFVSAAAWNNLSGGNDPLLKALLAKDTGTARAILDRLSPKSYAAMVAMPVESFNSDVRSIASRLEQRRYDRFSKNAQWEFFAQLQTASVENDTAPDAPTFDFDTTGLLAGADYKLDKNTTLGIALGASTGEAKVHNGGGKIESTDFRVTGFAGKTIENYFVNAGAQVGYASYDIKRNTDYGNASGDTTGWSAGLFADAGTVITLSEAKKIYATPYVGLAYMHTQADAFRESGSDKAFDADAISGDSLRARLGCGFSWGFAAFGAVWRLGLDVAFSHDFLGDEVDIDVTAQDGSSITETAKALPEDMFSIGPSFNVDVSSSSSIYGGYSFNAGTDSSVNHSANVGFRMRF